MSDNIQSYKSLQSAYATMKERMDLAEQLYEMANTEIKCLKSQKETIKERMPNMATPKLFSGKMMETKSFVQACLMYLMTRSSEFSGEKSKMLWVLSYMQEGTVLKYREAFLSVALREASVWGWPKDSLDELITNIKTMFGNPNKKDTKVFTTMTITQGEKTADEHVQDFKLAVYDSGYKGVALIYEFKCLLTKGLREKLNNLDKRPYEIEEWYSEAMHIDRQWRQAKAKEKIFGGS
jgi:hypothetical protein